jgi:hypothetical protein
MVAKAEAEAKLRAFELQLTRGRITLETERRIAISARETARQGRGFELGCARAFIGSNCAHERGDLH